MTDANAVVVAYWAAAESSEWETFGDLVAEQVVYKAPQYRERVRGRTAYVRFNVEGFPGDWHITVQRIIGEGRQAASWPEFSGAGDHYPGLCFFDLDQDGRITLGRSPEGRRLRRRVCGPAKAAVQDALKELRKEIDGGITRVGSGSCTVRLCCEDWLTGWLPGRDPMTVALRTGTCWPRCWRSRLPGPGRVRAGRWAGMASRPARQADGFLAVRLAGFHPSRRPDPQRRHAMTASCGSSPRY